MKICLNDTRGSLSIDTIDDGAAISVGLGLIARPNGKPMVNYLWTSFPTDRTYLSYGLREHDTFSIVVLPEGFTPATFGWEDIKGIRLSDLIQQMETS